MALIRFDGVCEATVGRGFNLFSMNKSKHSFSFEIPYKIGHSPLNGAIALFNSAREFSLGTLPLWGIIVLRLLNQKSLCEVLQSLI